MSGQIRTVFLQVVVVFISSCSLNHLPIGLSTYLIEQRMEGLNRLHDLTRAESELKENIQLLGRMLQQADVDPRFYIYDAHANFSYAFAFVEDRDVVRSKRLYMRAFNSALKALAVFGIQETDLNARSDQLEKKLSGLTKPAVPALYWLAMSWARLIELKQPDLVSLMHLHKTALLMQRVLELDRYYQHAGPYVFFAVYYSIRPVLLGGDPQRAREYFEIARKYNRNRLLMIDYLEAKYLHTGQAGQHSRRERIQQILKSPRDIYPGQELMNQIAKQKAASLISG